MGNRLKSYGEHRTQLRVKENKRVLWRLKEDSSQGGEGLVRNISLSGMLMETDCMLSPKEADTFAFDSPVGTQNGFIPRGRVVWKGEKGFLRKKYLYGIKFVEPDEEVFDNLDQRVQVGIGKLTNKRRWDKVARILLLFLILGLTGYSLWMGSTVYKDMDHSTKSMLDVSNDQAELTRNYKSLQQKTFGELTVARQELVETQELYKEGQRILQGVSKDLDEARAAMAQTDALLVQMQNENGALKGEIKALKDFHMKELAEVKADLNNTIDLLQKKNIKLVGEMNHLQSQMDYYGGDVQNMQESKALLRLYRNRMKLAKSKVKHFKREARRVRKTALKERDRLQSLLGNNGYFMKDGQVVQVDEEKYQMAAEEEEAVSKVSKPTSTRKVNIDVTFVE
ncbi:hypothetical protein MNBD_UNCLBAC01-402 [hydrothermal vent metagenome]|uniref:PilZ domain-containing protein n=1 Tax=hydrothermal vent metagenome TaxID=652676 RepID=A0A3B1D957_9ZZZZ